MKKFKIQFSKLIGNFYSCNDKMEILNWMIKTGRDYDVRINKWNVDGVGQLLYNYSANPYREGGRALPKEISDLSWYFDAIFARAVFQKTSNKAIKNWRRYERIAPNRSRIVAFNADKFISYEYIGRIKNFQGRFIEKQFAHPDYIQRTEPKIIGLTLYTTGDGWIFKYSFSFKEFDYEPGWDECICQKADESISQWLNRSVNHMLKILK